MKRVARRLQVVIRHLHAVLGGPGLMIGAFSILSFVFGLYIVVTEYDRPRQTGREVVHRVIASWIRVPDYLGQTLVDHAALWRDAPADPRREQLREALDRLGDALDHQSERFPLVHVISIDLVERGGPTVASWRARSSAESPSSEVIDHISLLAAAPGKPAVNLLIHYRVATNVDRAALGLETSYRRLLLALLGLSVFSLLCLAYMILHAQALSRRVAREAAQEATLDLADRTCHELGNGVFVLTNERRNLAEHLDCLERFSTRSPPPAAPPSAGSASRPTSRLAGTSRSAANTPPEGSTPTSNYAAAPPSRDTSATRSTSAPTTSA